MSPRAAVLLSCVAEGRGKPGNRAMLLLRDCDMGSRVLLPEVLLKLEQTLLMREDRRVVGVVLMKVLSKVLLVLIIWRDTSADILVSDDPTLIDTSAHE